MLRVIRMIIARKIVARREPHIATAMEVYAATGLNAMDQRDEAEALSAKGLLTIGRTFNGVYYKLKEYD